MLRLELNAPGPLEVPLVHDSRDLSPYLVDTRTHCNRRSTTDCGLRAIAGVFTDGEIGTDREDR